MESACFFGDLADFNNSPPHPSVLLVLCQILMNSLPNNRIFFYIWQSFDNSPPNRSVLFIYLAHITLHPLKFQYFYTNFEIRVQ